MPLYLRYTLIVLLGCLLFIPFIGHMHLFDWDEINFAECAREMIVSKDYLRAQIDFMPFWEKPPLFIWLQVLSMKLFGIGEFAARFPNALVGIITLCTLFYVGRRIVNEKMASWWVILYVATWLPHFYFKSGIIDPTFNLFIFLAFFQVHLLRYPPGRFKHAALAGLFLGLAVLTKGPVAILVAMLSFLVFIIANKGLGEYKIKHFFIIALFALLPILTWLTVAVIAYGAAYGQWFVSEFLWYQVKLFTTEDSDHGGPFIYHFIVLLIGCFPASAFLFQYHRKPVTGKPVANNFDQWMWILFWVVLILFSIVKTKIVHYSSLCYFPLTFLAANQIYQLTSEHEHFKKWIKWLVLSLGSILAVLITAIPIVGINKDKLIPIIEDPFVVGNLHANVSWSYVECTWGILYLLAIITSVYFMGKDFRRGILILCISQIIIIQATILHFTPKIELYSQRSAIDFFSSFEGKDVYVQPVGYKSYANLFYTQKIKSTNPNYTSTRTDIRGKKLQPEANEQWLLNGAIDKPAYFICKVMDAYKLRALPQLEEIGGSNGFVFFKRKSLLPLAK